MATLALILRSAEGVSRRMATSSKYAAILRHGAARPPQDEVWCCSTASRLRKHPRVVGRDDDANRVLGRKARHGTELDRLQPMTERLERVGGLRAVKMTLDHARWKTIGLGGFAVRTQQDIFR